MFLWGTSEDGQVGKAEGPQWALGGDTWVVGCAIPSCTVFPEYNQLNPDMQDPKYNTGRKSIFTMFAVMLLYAELGMYQEKCGFEKLQFAYGHDEYMYRMLVRTHVSMNAIALPYYSLQTTPNYLRRHWQ